MGYISVDEEDESRKEAENVAQLLLDTFVENMSLNATADTTREHDCDDIVEVMARIPGMEAKHLCHLIRIRFIADERAAVTYS
jgi:hypothetical protein